MPQGRALAYSLSHDAEVWRWCVYDEDGETVADGAHPTQDAAQAAVDLTLRRAGGDRRVTA
ncbi:hypothetical protein [Phenylobacterium sp. SCN 70-31]|uniref:hypothetical protein n=1 Tax=Phenylobacterium sp. SCN 70-31 TaxID=1660129 RepID=UPI00086AAC00|nr:hypothetical protein [Phenylobacterium sp. SCN 70-31]ODT86569.1 MAG: hypothetical protein ABS78_15800 [Phenylobacterium sp. SCN 70-31]